MNTEKREKKRNCIIIGCNSTSTDHKGIKFFRFPSKDTIEYEIWMSRCRASYNRIISLNNPLICSLHFNPDEIGKQRLHSKAYPNLKLSLPPKCVVEDDLKSKMTFMDKVIREWILRSRQSQNISSKTVSIASRDVRTILNIPRHVPNPQWMRDFDYLPILPDANGVVLISRPYCRSQILDVIRDLENTVDQGQDTQQQSEDEISPSSFEILHLKTEGPEDGDQASNIKTENETEDEDFELYDQSESDTKTIDSYEDALEYLRPLERFVKQRKERFAAIGLVTQLKTIFKDQISQDGDLTHSRRTF